MHFIVRLVLFTPPYDAVTSAVTVAVSGYNRVRVRSFNRRGGAVDCRRPSSNRDRDFPAARGPTDARAKSPGPAGRALVPIAHAPSYGRPLASSSAAAAGGAKNDAASALRTTTRRRRRKSVRSSLHRRRVAVARVVTGLASGRSSRCRFQKPRTDRPPTRTNWVSIRVIILVLIR